MSAFTVRFNRPQRLAVAAATLVLFGTAMLPASAGTTPDDPPGRVTPQLSTQLSRVGTQYVRGDELTGAGVAAPTWIPELP